MDVLRTVVAAAVAVAALASCSGDEATSDAVDAASTSASATPAASAEELFATIDAAVAKETSVRQEQGNLNPPPTVVLDQEYGDGRDQLALTVDLGPTDPLRIYHVDGLLYFEGEAPKPTSEIDPDDTAWIAVLLRTDVRQDLQRMARLADDFSYLGEEEMSGVTTHHYRVMLSRVPSPNPATLPAEMKGPKPADLWIATGGLPVRVEMKYSEPLGGIPGTGVVRTDYSSWSKSLNLDPENLEWD